MSARGAAPTRAECATLDAADPLAWLADEFERPSGAGVAASRAAPGEARRERAGDAPHAAARIFLDGNSMGAMPRTVPERLLRAVRDEWNAHRRHAWTIADWLDAPQRIGAGYARLLGARADELIAVDNTTLNLHKLLAYGLQLAAPDARRRAIVYERDGFPTDAHVVQGIVHHGAGRWIARPIDAHDESLRAALGDEVAMVVLSHADYRSSRRWDMARVEAMARAAGTRVLWDLSHTAGAVRVDLAADGASMAVACAYKYLSAGPGAPALAYLRRDLHDRGWPALPGWLGHADRMNFVVDYAPAPGMLSLVTGTMPVLQNAVAECAARVFARVDPAQLAARHRSLVETLKALLRERCGPLGVELVSPREYDAQGGHVAFRCPGGGPVCEALLEAGVVGSFRQPDTIRFGLAPATLSHVDVHDAVQRLHTILVEERWRDPKFSEVSV